MKNSWKEAATIILTAFSKAQIKGNWNYQVLTLQRSLKSSFMPNGYVFPGGVTESADSKHKWLDLFSDINLDYKNLCKINGTVPDIIKNETGEIPKLLSLKITAIRETFEETGILLCVSKDKFYGNSDMISVNNFEGLDLWRQKVQKDASEFFNLCYHYKCYPDVRNLHLWSNWLTPTSMGKKRFDTAFFIACLEKMPVAAADEKEIEKLNWSTPEQLMDLCKAKEIWLPPPQVYETTRLLQFRDITALNKFALNRSIQGCERWMPVQVKTSNGSVSLLPQDDAYSVVDFNAPTEAKKIDMSNEEFRLQSNVLHRMEFVNEIETKVIVKNYNPANGHVPPMSEKSKY